jgi:hypothetical protein
VDCDDSTWLNAFQVSAAVFDVFVGVSDRPGPWLFNGDGFHMVVMIVVSMVLCVGCDLSSHPSGICKPQRQGWRSR